MELRLSHSIALGCLHVTEGGSLEQERSDRPKPSSDAELEPSEARGTWKDRVQMRLLPLLLTSEQYRTLSTTTTLAILFHTIVGFAQLCAQIV